MDGGCLNLWLGKPLINIDKQFINHYGNYLASKHPAFTIRINEKMFTDKFEIKQVKKLFGFLPSEEIVVCGWADDIFNASEAILKEFGGYFTTGTGATKEDFKNLPGKWVQLKKKHKYLPLISVRSRIIIDWEFLKNYFNRTTTEETRIQFSLDNFRTIKNKYQNEPIELYTYGNN